MKKKVFILFTVLLVAALALFMFAACDDNSQKGGTGTNTDGGTGTDTSQKTFYENMTFDYLYGVIDSAKNYTIVTEEKDYDVSDAASPVVWLEVLSMVVDNETNISYAETTNTKGGETYTLKEYVYESGAVEYLISLNNYTIGENGEPIKNESGNFALKSAEKKAPTEPFEITLGDMGNESFNDFASYTIKSDNLFYMYIYNNLSYENGKVIPMPMEGCTAELIIEDESFGVIYHFIENGKTIKDYSLVIKNVNKSALTSVPDEVKAFESEAVEK